MAFHHVLSIMWPSTVLFLCQAHTCMVLGLHHRSMINNILECNRAGTPPLVVGGLPCINP